MGTGEALNTALTCGLQRLPASAACRCRCRRITACTTRLKPWVRGQHRKSIARALPVRAPTTNAGSTAQANPKRAHSGLHPSLTWGQLTHSVPLGHGSGAPAGAHHSGTPGRLPLRLLLVMLLLLLLLPVLPRMGAT